MAALNRAMLIGNLGRDCELKYTTSGVAVASLSLATTETWKDANGQKREDTQWHRIVVWDKLAETLAPFLEKGKQIYVEGKIQTREWDDKDGKKVRTTEIRADRIFLLGSRKGSNGAGAAVPHPAETAGNDDDVPF